MLKCRQCGREGRGHVAIACPPYPDASCNAGGNMLRIIWIVPAWWYRNKNIQHRHTSYTITYALPWGSQTRTPWSCQVKNVDSSGKNHSSSILGGPRGMLSCKARPCVLVSSYEKGLLRGHTTAEACASQPTATVESEAARFKAFRKAFADRKGSWTTAVTMQASSP